MYERPKTRIELMDEFFDSQMRLERSAAMARRERFDSRKAFDRTMRMYLEHAFPDHLDQSPT